MSRVKAEAYILTYIDKLLPGSGNVDIYKRFFKSLNDLEFKQFMEDLESGKRILSIQVPNLTQSRLTVERNVAIAKELGHNFFERIWMPAVKDIPEHLTPIEYLVVDLPLRRASQLLTKKIKIPEHSNVVDALTGQPTGESKGATISHNELQVCAAMGLENSMVELMKYRGGDNKGLVALNGMLSKYGTANLKTLANYASGVESTKTLKTFLTCMHLKSTL